MSQIKTLAAKVADGKKLNASEKKIATAAKLIDSKGLPNTAVLDEIFDSEVKEQENENRNVIGTDDFVMIDTTRVNDKPLDAVTEPIVALEPTHPVTSSTHVVIGADATTAKKRGRPAGIAQPTIEQKQERRLNKIAAYNVKIATLTAERDEIQEQHGAAIELYNQRAAKQANDLVTRFNPNLMTTEQKAQLRALLDAADSVEVNEDESEVEA